MRKLFLVVALCWLPSAQPAPAQWGLPQGSFPSLVPSGWASAPAAVDRVTPPRWFFPQTAKAPRSLPSGGEGSATPRQRPPSHIATAPSVGLLASASPTTPHATNPSVSHATAASDPSEPKESKKESAEAKAALERERELRRHAESEASEASHRVSALRAEADAAKRAAADANKARHAAEADTARARDEARRAASQLDGLKDAAARAADAQRRADHAASIALKQAAASHAVAVDATWQASQAAASAQVCCLPLACPRGISRASGPDPRSTRRR